jgi:serine protease Do
VSPPQGFNNASFGRVGFGNIAENLRRSTVHVRAGRHGQGSGIILSPDGLIVTNAHVASSRPLEVQLWDGSHSHAAILARDAARDLAFLRIAKSGLPAATLADSDKSRVGELVIAVGNPFGFIGAITTGVIHAIGQVNGLAPLKWIQADVQLAPGNSGGPLANAEGQVVGVNTMIAGGVGLAVPSNTVARLLNRLRNGAPQAPFGVTLRPVEIKVGNKAQLCLAILDVSKNSAAERASLMRGDILIAVEGRHFESIEDLDRALDGTGAHWSANSNERVIRIQFLRGDPTRIRTVSVRLGLATLAAA